jgi:hypothetical protein
MLNVMQHAIAGIGCSLMLLVLKRLLLLLLFLRDPIGAAVAEHVRSLL